MRQIVDEIKPNLYKNWQKAIKRDIQKKRPVSGMNNYELSKDDEYGLTSPTKDLKQCKKKDQKGVVKMNIW